MSHKKYETGWGEEGTAKQESREGREEGGSREVQDTGQEIGYLMVVLQDP